jgi:mRNA interferase MazF
MNKILPVVNILPITSRKKGRKIYPNEVLIPQGMYGLTNESIVLCYQIRTLDKKRLEKELGEIKDEIIKETIIESLSFQLGIYKNFMIDNAENLTEASEKEKAK